MGSAFVGPTRTSTGTSLPRERSSADKIQNSDVFSFCQDFFWQQENWHQRSGVEPPFIVLETMLFPERAGKAPAKTGERRSDKPIALNWEMWRGVK